MRAHGVLFLVSKETQIFELIKRISLEVLKELFGYRSSDRSLLFFVL